MKEEKQLELELPMSPELPLKFTEEELKRIYQVLGFVSSDSITDDIHKKLDSYVGGEDLDGSYEKVFLRQTTIEEDSFILPKEDLSMYNNGYVLLIKD